MNQFQYSFNFITFLLFNYYYSILNIKPNYLEGSTDSDDEKLRSKSQGSLVEFRRLKRITLARKKKKFFKKHQHLMILIEIQALVMSYFKNFRLKIYFYFKKQKIILRLFMVLIFFSI